MRILTEEGFADDGGRKAGARGGVVHSFTGTAEEIKELVSNPFSITSSASTFVTDGDRNAN